MFNPMDEPELIAAGVGLCLVCVFVGVTLKVLLSLELYIPAGGLLGLVVGCLVYFDRLKRPT